MRKILDLVGVELADGVCIEAEGSSVGLTSLSGLSTGVSSGGAGADGPALLDSSERGSAAVVSNAWAESVTREVEATRDASDRGGRATGSTNSLSWVTGSIPGLLNRGSGSDAGNDAEERMLE